MKKLRKEPDFDDKDYGPNDIGLVPPGVGVDVRKPKLRLVGADGNAFAILGRAFEAARASGWSIDHWKKFRDEAMSSDYDHLLATCVEHFDVH